MGKLDSSDQPSQATFLASARPKPLAAPMIRVRFIATLVMVGMLLPISCVVDIRAA